MSLVLGLVGIGLLGLWVRRSRQALHKALPSIALVLYGVVTIVFISTVRGQFAPWYTMHFIAFWLGMIGLGFLLLVHPWAEALSQIGYRMTTVSRSVWSILAFGMTIVPVIGNQDYRPHQFVMAYRAPVSEACVRYYRVAPTYCNDYVFLWGYEPGLVQRAAALQDRRKWATFRSQQRWTLQGDYLFDTVRVNPSEFTPEFVWYGWTPSLQPDFVPATDYRHLNLFLHSPSVVAWTVHFPLNTRAADLYTAIMLSPDPPGSPATGVDGVRFEIYVEPEGQPRTLEYAKVVQPGIHGWEPVHLALNRFAGQTVTLYLKPDPLTNIVYDWALFRYPYIDVELDSSVPQVPQPLPDEHHFLPDLSTSESTVDLRAMASQQTTANMTPVNDAPDTWVIGHSPALTLSFDPALCSLDYTHLFVRLAASPDLTQLLPVGTEQVRFMAIYYRVAGQAEFHEWQKVVIPLERDGEAHNYFYPIRLLNLPINTQIAGLRVSPVISGVEGSENRVQIRDVRLVRRGGESLAQLCATP